MWFSRRKKVKEITIPETPHEHTWKDMPWYIHYEYDGGNKKAEYQIMEPYICITCGERKDVQLESRHLTGVNYEEGMGFIKEVEKKYKRYIKPRAVVEDMINNILLVRDPQYLEMVENIRGTPHKNVGTSARMRPQGTDKSPKIDFSKKE